METEDAAKTPDETPPELSGLSEPPAPDESRPDPTEPPEPSEPERPDWRRRGNLVGIALLAAAVVAALLVWWSPWDRWFACNDDAEHVVDEESGLCYAHPEDWVEMSEAERAEEAEESGRGVNTSSLRSPEDHIAWIDVGPAERYVLGSIPSGELEGLARELVTLSQAMSEGDPEVESESLEIDGREAGTATAQMPQKLFGVEGAPEWIVEDAPEWILWVRATVVDVEDGTSVMITTALVEPAEVDDEEGTIAILEDIHDSIAVR